MLRQRAALEQQLQGIEKLGSELRDAIEYLELAAAEDDASALQDAIGQADRLVKLVREAELRRMLSGPVDHADAIVSIHPGTGGTDAKDWAQMLMRMYLRWCDVRGFKTDIIDMQGRRRGRHRQRVLHGVWRECLRLHAGRDRRAPACAHQPL